MHRLRLFVLLCAISTIVGARALAANDIADSAVPKELTSSDWSSIRAAYEANRHAVFPVGAEWHARNPAQQWKVRFDGRGFVVAPDARDWSWGLELVRFGRKGEMQDLAAPRCIDTQGGRVSYEWNDSLTEWYVNDGRGLEHGFTVHRPPVGAGDAGLLHVTLAVRGDLRPHVGEDRRSVTFVNTTNGAVVNYSGLTVFDADGVSLPSFFELNLNDNRGPVTLELSVADIKARYPLVIDPIAQQAYLKASNPGTSDIFGVSVAVSGDTVVVGARDEDSSATGIDGNQGDNSANNSGAAYVFVRSAGAWAQQAYLKASNTGLGDNFGNPVALSGDTVVVGARMEDSSATGVNGNQADNSAGNSGAAYVYVRSGTTWSQQAYLKASNTGLGDNFGNSVAVSGDMVIVGAIEEDSSAIGVNGDQSNNSSSGSGAAYVFKRDTGGVWTQETYLKASNTGLNDNFGSSVGVSGDTVVVGAVLEDSNATGVDGNQADNSASNSGATYVFVQSGGVWSQQAYLKASNTGATDQSGWSVAVSGDAVVVGAPYEDSSATGVNGNQGDNSSGDSGAAYVFVRNAGVWTQQAYLKASNSGALDYFGESVAISGDTVVVGATEEDGNAMGVNGNQSDNSANNSGAAYVFVRSAGAWNQQAYLKASNTGAGDQFGESVTVSGDTVVVGGYREDSSAAGVNGNQADGSAAESGAAYVFTGVGCPTLGNLNCDCAVDLIDVDAFVIALLDPDVYALTFTGCNILNADMQPDGLVNGADIQGFVELLVP